jgi:LemA protein
MSGSFPIVPIVIGVLVVIVVIWGIGAYNRFVQLRNMIEQSWRQVDVELNRRYELIPNIVETVKGYAGYERGTLEGVTALRNQAAALASQSNGQPTAERAQVESQLSAMVHNRIVSVEAYPDLKANANFLALQQELVATEDRIANGRRFYNANVGTYNTKIQSFPGNLIANFAKFQNANYFEAPDQARTATRVDFTGFGSQPPVPPQAQPPYGAVPQVPAQPPYNAVPPAPVQAPYNAVPQAPGQAPYSAVPQVSAQPPYNAVPPAPVQAPYNAVPQAPAQPPYGTVPQAPAQPPYNAAPQAPIPPQAQPEYGTPPQAPSQQVPPTFEPPQQPYPPQ